ncbi:MAG: hypothetical protein H6581_12060 [Bacteroidia bacterium]|nr:hypothetical protein [Bacteroidia bacterium]
MDFNYFIGKWKNPFDQSKGIQSFEIRQESDGRVTMEVQGVSQGYFPAGWGQAEVNFLASTPGGTQASAFSASFQLPGRNVFLAGNINKGLIIIAIYALDAKGNQDNNLFVREFYHKLT